MAKDKNEKTPQQLFQQSATLIKKKAVLQVVKHPDIKPELVDKLYTIVEAEMRTLPKV